MAVLIACTGAQAEAQVPGPPAAAIAQYDSAYFAWDRGEYLLALDHAERVLTGPGGDALLDRVALLTGELFQVSEVAPQGEDVRWSPDGRHLSLQTGSGGSAQIQIYTIDGGTVSHLATLPGRDANFLADGNSVAYLRLPSQAALQAARVAEQAAIDSGDEVALTNARAEISVYQAQQWEIVQRTIATGEETILPAGDLERYDLAAAGDGTVILVGRRPRESDRYDLFALRPGAEPRRLSRGPGMKGTHILPAGAARIVYTIGDDRFAVHDLRRGDTDVFEGTGPVVSRDGSTVAYLHVVAQPDPELRRGEAATGADVDATGALNALMILDVENDSRPRALKQSTLPLANLALSPSGSQLAYNTIVRDDWEIFVADTETGAEQRVTREIQHDLYPQFLTEDTLLALMGESRHRRAYLYDLATPRAQPIAAAPIAGEDQRGRIQLFHNNTLRTVAPQYAWVPSPDGSKVLITADRDGDTLSPERGVYLVDLDAKVDRQEVLERVAAQRASERQLRRWGEQIFAPLATEVQEVVGRVEVARIYDNAHALYQFDSKYITQPGNALAIEYLANSLRKMGYEPELECFEPRPGVRTANVIATLRGTESPERINVISSHFDSVERSPGADDNSSGTTALLEAARVLATNPQPETIRFAFFTGEEAGLLGSREHLRRSREAGDQIVSVLNNDMVGWSGNHRLDNTIRYSNATLRDIQHSAALLFSDLITYDARYVRNTDAQAFWDEYGDIIGGIGSYPILGNPHYHEPHDHLEVLNHRLVAEVAKTTIATVMLMASGFELEAS